jgi:hypothetical protein
MTKRLERPGKRGVSRLNLRLLVAKWERFERDHPIAGSTIDAEDRAELFFRRNRLWLNKLGLNPNGDQQLRNKLTKGRKARAAEMAYRKGLWRIVRDDEGRRKIDPLGAYIEYAAAIAVGVRK